MKGSKDDGFKDEPIAWIFVSLIQKQQVSFVRQDLTQSLWLFTCLGWHSLTVALDLLRKTHSRRRGTRRRRATVRSSRKLERRLRGVMRTARRASNVEVPSFLRQLVKETEKMVTFFFKGGSRDSGSAEEDNFDDDSLPSPYLDRPILEKYVSEGGSTSGLNYAVASMQGWRAQMEDAHTCMPQLRGDLEDWGYFAVFDGHAGITVAQYCSRNLLEHILVTGTGELLIT